MKLQHDQLKYWRVIRKFFKMKYGISDKELDILLFLYSEDYFTKAKFRKFQQLINWRDATFNSLFAKGYIVVFRDIPTRRQKKLYALSPKAKRMINSLYKKLNGEEIPVYGHNNPLFKRNITVYESYYRDMIIEMNKAITGQPHLAQE